VSRRAGRDDRGHRLARIVTEVSAPAVLIVFIFVAVGSHSVRNAAVGLAWGLFAAFFASLIPFAWIVGNVRRGRLTDHHVGVREQRPVPLLVGLGSVLTGLLLMVLLDAPGPIRALVAVGAVGLAVGVPVSRHWKMSIHAAVAAGSAVVTVLVFGPPLFLVWPALLLIGWSRVRLGDHTVPQVMVGALVGGVVAGGVFLALR
jgi:membrane-associated phospholipid phosphatase